MQAAHLRWLRVIPILAAFALLTGCPSKKPKDPACDGDKDCQTGEHCVNGKCVQCADSGHCPKGMECRSGACVTPESACSSDEDCGEGESCIDGQCRACQTDDECGPGGKCQSGVCERPKACEVDEDCADDEDCVEGRCLQPWKSEAPADLDCELVIVYFDFDQSVIRDDARELLNANAECILAAPADRGVYINGHTDQEGTEEYNIALSERRAGVVADYLARLGIDPARFHVIAKGEGEPTGRGDDSDRRVEFEWQ